MGLDCRASGVTDMTTFFHKCGGFQPFSCYVLKSCVYKWHIWLVSCSYYHRFGILALSLYITVQFH